MLKVNLVCNTLNIFYFILALLLVYFLLYKSFLSLLFAIFFISYFIKPNVLFNIFYLIFMPMLIALINSIRSPTQDGLNYINDYLGLNNSIIGHKSDIFFYSINDLIYVISNGNEQFFMFFWSFLFYFNILLSLYILYRSNILSYKAFVISSFILIVTPMYMVMSTHLIRQFLAQSFLILSVSLYIVNNKKYYISLVLMVLTHFSSLIFVPLFFIKRFKSKLSLLTIVMMAILTIIIRNINIFVYLDNIINILGVDLGIYSGMIRGAAEVLKDDGSVSIMIHILSISFLFYLFYFIYYKKENRYVFIFNIMLFSYLLFNALMSVQLLWLRFSFYQYVFYPIILGLIISTVKSKYIKIFIFLLVLLYGIKYVNLFEKFAWVDSGHAEQLFDKNLLYFLEVKKNGL